MVNKILRVISNIPIIWRLRHKRLYPGINFGNGVSFEIDGLFSYAGNCSLGQNSILVIPKDTELELGKGCYIGRYVELGPSKKIIIGNQTSIQDRCIFLGEVTVGNYCVFAPNIYISSGQHHFRLRPPMLIKDQDKLAAVDATIKERPVTIEDDCWLGINTVVMAGITIGKGAVVGANAVVTKDVEPYAVVAGNPAKLISRRLEFIPPVSIAADCENDRPYFYQGFAVSETEISQYGMVNGLVAKDKFSLCLALDNAKNVSIEMKTLHDECVEILRDDGLVALSREWKEVIFTLTAPEKQNNKIHIQLEKKNALVGVRKAKAQ